MKVLSWNCRGLGNPSTRRYIKELCRVNCPDVLVLLETRSNSAFTLSLPKSLNFSNNVRIPSDGYAGGLWLFWTENNFSLKIVKENYQFFHCEVTERDKPSWYLTLAYVRPNTQDKEEFWRSMGLFR